MNQSKIEKEEALRKRIADKVIQCGDFLSDSFDRGAFLN
jgi:hypothetical protein